MTSKPTVSCSDFPPPPQPSRGSVEVRTDKLRFFRTPGELRRWLEKKHASEQELWIGFYRKDSGRGGVTYSEALDEALCFGWIDGIRKKLDDLSYTTRFTPRKPRSNWSNVNIGHVKRLAAANRMAEPGLAAFKLRDPAQSAIYSFERETADLSPPMRAKLESNARAREFFGSQPPRYKRAVIWWVISAKKEETRERRLAQLIDRSAEGLWIPQFIPIPKRSKPN